MDKFIVILGVESCPRIGVKVYNISEQIVEEYYKDNVLSFKQVKDNLKLEYSVSKITKIFKNSVTQEEFEFLKDKKRKLFNSKSNKNKIFIRCNICNKEFLDNFSGGFTKHLRKEHNIIDINIDDYYTIIDSFTENYSSYSKIKPYAYTCMICNKGYRDKKNISGQFTLHILKDHALNIKDYVELYPEHSYLFERTLRRLSEESDRDITFKCSCGSFIRKMTQQHLDKYHSGIKLSEFSKNNQTVSPKISKILSEVAKNTNINNIYNSVSKCELGFAKKLDSLNIQYETQFKIDNKYYDFYLPGFNKLIEVDGSYWHGFDIKESFYADQFINFNNDIKKNIIASQHGYNLNRVWEFSLDNINVVEDIEKNQYHRDYNINFFSPILRLPYNVAKKDSVINSIYEYLLVHYPNIIDDDIPIDIDSIGIKNVKMDNNTITNYHDDVFYTWATFRGFYSSKMIGSRSIIDNFYDFKVFNHVLSWLYDNSVIMSRFNIFKNLRYFRKTGVSTFSHSLTLFLLEYIKDKYNKQINTIYDPFSGWGNRLVGFWLYNNKHGLKMVYSNDLCIETYEDNITLSNKLGFDNIHFTSVDASTNIVDSDIDIVFSCPPYYEYENYGIKEFTKEDLYKTIKILPNESIKCFVVNDILLNDIKSLVNVKEVINIKLKNKNEYAVIW